MKVFLTISFVMSLILMSCDASIMSSNSVVEDENEDDLKPTGITEIYEGVDDDEKKYKIVLSKVEVTDEKYSLDFYIDDKKQDIGESLEEEKKDKEFTFGAMRTFYTLLFGDNKNAPTLTFGNESNKVTVTLTKQP